MSNPESPINEEADGLAPGDEESLNDVGAEAAEELRPNGVRNMMARSGPNNGPQG